jgi:hypothetical protein
LNNEEYVKNFRSGFLCLGLVTAAWAQDPQTPPAQTPPAAPPQPAVVVQPAPKPDKPEKPDIRMPGETGWDIGILGWFPTQHPIIDKGKAADFTNPSRATFAGKPKYAEGADIGIAVGRHNQLHIYYFDAKASGNFTAPNDFSVWTQSYSKGDLISTNYHWQNVKISYEYLTWPFPVETRRFRLKTLWQVQYFNVRNVFDAPLLPTTDSAGNLLSDASGNPLTYSTEGSKWFILPTFGLGVQEYASRHFRLEANVSGFGIPHKSALLDADASANIRAGHFELRFGAKAFHFKTSPKADFYNRGTYVAPFVGIRWYSE